jgi:hypothetical protein
MHSVGGRLCRSRLGTHSRVYSRPPQHGTSTDTSPVPTAATGTPSAGSSPALSHSFTTGCATAPFAMTDPPGNGKPGVVRYAPPR